MKMLFLVTDSEYQPHCLHALHEKGVRAYTLIPGVYGLGRTGAKMGDRTHPGGSIILISVLPDEVVDDILGFIRQCIAENRLCDATHAWVLPIDASLAGADSFPSEGTDDTQNPHRR